MGWSFELSVECGSDHASAVGIKQHFDGIEFVLNDASGGRWMVEYVSDDEDGRWWVTVLTFVRGKALESGDDPELLASAGMKLYERLKSAPRFRFAVVGIETFQFNRAEALPNLLGHPALRGLVVNEVLFEALGHPRDFVSFSDGYFWLPAKYDYS